MGLRFSPTARGNSRRPDLPDPENLESPWIHFEAGALSKTLQHTYVCPYLFELEPIDISGPLVQFQATKAAKEDTRKLVHTINKTLGDEALSAAKLNESFDVWWPGLEQQLREIPRTLKTPKPYRSDREILEEILEFVRAFAEMVLLETQKPGPAGSLFFLPGPSEPDRGQLRRIDFKPWPPMEDDTSNDT